jgi:hypothetical protein
VAASVAARGVALPTCEAPRMPRRCWARRHFRRRVSPDCLPPAARMMRAVRIALESLFGSSEVRHQGAHPARAGREPWRLRRGRHAGSPVPAELVERVCLEGPQAPGAESTRRAVRAGLWSHSRDRMGAGTGERYICFSADPAEASTSVAFAAACPLCIASEPACLPP